MVITFYTFNENATREGDKVSTRSNQTANRQGDIQKYPDNGQKQKRGYPSVSGAEG